MKVPSFFSLLDYIYPSHLIQRATNASFFSAGVFKVFDVADGSCFSSLLNRLQSFYDGKRLLH